MPSLSLSTYWEEVSRIIEQEYKTRGQKKVQQKSLVGIPITSSSSSGGEDGSGSAESKRSNTTTLMSIPELEYLKHDERLDHKHDPLQLVQNIYGAAAAFAASATPHHRSVLLSACLAIAAKSGRASLLLHLATVLFAVEFEASSGSNTANNNIEHNNNNNNSNTSNNANSISIAEEPVPIDIDIDSIRDMCEYITNRCKW